MLCSNDEKVTYTISAITLEYDMIVNAEYKEKVSIAQQNISYPYTRVTRLSYEQKSKKDTTWLINTTLQATSLQGLLILFLEDQTDFAYKVENFYNPTIKKVNVIIDGELHHLFKGLVLSRMMFPEICKKFYQENADVSFKQYLTTKYSF